MSNASERTDLADELREGIAEAERQTVRARELTAFWIMEPPRFRVKTSDNLVPAAENTREAVVEDFASAQEELIRSMRTANGIDLGGAKVASPMSTRLKWSVGQVFRIALAHNRRHLWQAKQVIDHPAFPAI